MDVCTVIYKCWTELRIYSSVMCKILSSLYSYLVGSPPFKFSESLEEGGDPRADACHFSLDNTSCLAARTEFGRAFCTHVWVDPHKESFNRKKGALILK